MSQYVFVPDRGEMSRGIPTLYAADPLKGKFSNTDEPPPVWPDPNGIARGITFSPLYKSAPKAAREDQALYLESFTVGPMKRDLLWMYPISWRGLRERTNLEPSAIQDSRQPDFFPCNPD